MKLSPGFTYDNCPDCLRLTLTLDPGRGTYSQFELLLSLEWHESWQSLGPGQVKLGLKGGRFHLTIAPGTIFLPNVAILESLTPEVEATGTKIILLPQQEEKVWSFAVLTRESVLKGSVEKVKLGTVKIESEPGDFTGSLMVLPAEVTIIEAEGLWRHDINPNQHAVLERTLARFFWENYFNPIVSRFELSNPTVPQGTGVKGKVNSQPILELMAKVIEAKTQNFQELVNLAQLDLSQDLAGGNLRGVNLNGLDFSGANLAGVNLRGAELCDLDLSEANLQRAILSGADLSGAYLERGDLREADLHRSSLALVNLGGADLRGANLQGANLSQVNWSGTKLEGAKFGENVGLTVENKRYIEEHGGVFVR